MIVTDVNSFTSLLKEITISEDAGLGAIEKTSSLLNIETPVKILKLFFTLDLDLLIC